MLAVRPTAQPVEVIAHRGASAYAAENSLAAFDVAVATGADRLEFDVRATADGELVLLHDPTFLRTAGDPRAVADVTLAELQSLPEPVRPPTLWQVLDRFEARTRYLVEIKQAPVACEGQLVAMLAARGLREHVVVQSFDHLLLARLARRDAGLALAALFEAGADVAGALDGVSRVAGAIGPCWSSVDPALVGAAHARGLAVRAWTVNAEAEMERLVALGVDGIITDVPDRAREVVERCARLPRLAA